MNLIELTKKHKDMPIEELESYMLELIQEMNNIVDEAAERRKADEIS